MTKIVIAKYKEDLSWTTKLPPEIEVCVVNKDEGGDLPNNAGREANSYAWYILQNWDTLEGEYIFSQGRYDDQAPNFPEEIMTDRRYFGKIYICDDKGFPNYPNLCLDRYCEMFGVNVEKGSPYMFRCGGFFKLSAAEIKDKGKDWWQKVFDVTSVEPESSHCFERLWSCLFPALQDDFYRDGEADFSHWRML